MSDIYSSVSSSLDAEWYPYHEDEWFTHKEICDHFGWREIDTRHALSQKLYYDSVDKKPPYLEKKGKTYRIIDRSLDEIDWQSADSNKTLDIFLPFNLHEYVKFFPKSVIVIAGASNAGKTAWIYNFILMNMYKHKITLYNSETSREQMKERFLNFEEEMPNPPPFRTVERYDNFADVINPNEVSAIDYVDADDDFYRNGIEISRIYRALDRGMAVIGIQKKSDFKTFKGQIIKQKLGYGGDTTIKRASLYIAMDAGTLEIVKAQSW